jgi:aspartyl-tRNA(Asn)/glutamyl-tRNA(Gln) amidotransferase subunit C
MSDISEDSVRHLAGLARIDLTNDEVTHLTAELSKIVDVVATVSAAATDDVPATSHPIPLTNVYREDVVTDDVLTTEQALSGAPEHDGSRFKVSAILGEEQ